MDQIASALYIFMQFTFYFTFLLALGITYQRVAGSNSHMNYYGDIDNCECALLNKYRNWKMIVITYKRKVNYECTLLNKIDLKIKISTQLQATTTIQLHHKFDEIITRILLEFIAFV